MRLDKVRVARNRRPDHSSRGSGHDDSSIDQPAADGGQETVVENISRRGTLVKFEVLGDLADRTFEPGGIDAAEAVVPDLAGQDVVRYDRTQPCELELARAAFHPADHVVGGAHGIADR